MRTSPMLLRNDADKYNMKQYIIGFFIGLLLSFMVFCAALGIANTTATQNRYKIDSLQLKVGVLQRDIEYLEARKDTICVKVDIQPQIIKIDNRCYTD